ncbi:Toxoplasma gondii family A protein [Besnoitia besnoiti]|uniref:Toxoplasma gondii family A protein n=1 Tax=Besnoitia besnoiti TaxID=94643 RepID=A0A2A9MHS7_BESBE|nr:Toxoplasma gondii family A protein [Besnoitia besnoiti]PFH36744.1 Toxoplasma gondii family A protein [Besnoitia besnoiti]
MRPTTRVPLALFVNAALQWCMASAAEEPHAKPDFTITIAKEGLETDIERVVWLGPGKVLRVEDGTNAAIFLPQAKEGTSPSPEPQALNSVAYVFEDGKCNFEKTVEYKKLFSGYELPLWLRSPAAPQPAEGVAAGVAAYTFTNPPAEKLVEPVSFCVRFKTSSPDSASTKQSRSNLPPETRKPGNDSSQRADDSLDQDAAKGTDDEVEAQDGVNNTELSNRLTTPMPSAHGMPQGTPVIEVQGPSGVQGEEASPENETHRPAAPALGGLKDPAAADDDKEGPTGDVGIHGGAGKVEISDKNSGNLPVDPPIERDTSKIPSDKESNAVAGGVVGQEGPPQPPSADETDEKAKAEKEEESPPESKKQDQLSTPTQSGEREPSSAEPTSGVASGDPASASVSQGIKGESGEKAGPQEVGREGDLKGRLRRLATPAETKEKYLTIVVHSGARHVAAGTVALVVSVFAMLGAFL